MKRKISLIGLLLFITALQSISQYYVTGQDPASLKWKQIVTAHFTIIFPESFSGMAGHYASLLEESYTNAQTLYPEARTKIPVIIHNYSMESNGYVVWAPKRMELYPLPGQDNLPLDPARLLTMHEVTHVMEMASLNKGFTKILSYLLGEQSIGITSATVPTWALEGDAVYAETFFSESGRGRSNAFMQEAKAISAGENGIYNYNKTLFGSYRDFTPDHYIFGYAMMNYLRATSPDAWKDAISFSARNPFLINPVNLSLRGSTGITKKKLFTTTFDTLKAQWASKEKSSPKTIYPSLNPDKKGEYENYYSPFCTGKGKYIALKSSLSETQHFVVIDAETGREKKLLSTGYIYPAVFSYAQGTVVWAEYKPDPRWENRNYSVIKKMDLRSGSVKQLTFRSRLSAPAISADGTCIVAISTTPEMKTSLVFIDPLSGVITHQADAPDSVILQLPEWSDDNTSVVAASLTREGEGIIQYKPAENRWKQLLENTHRDIIKVEYHDNCLYALIQDDESDNIYLKRLDEPFTRITNSRFGISSFSIAGDTVLFSDYSTLGFNVCYTSINTSNNLPYLSPNKNIHSDKIKNEEANISEKENHLITPYRKAGHLFNFHSWTPFYFDIDEMLSDPTLINPGFTLLSQNNLSTLISSVAYEYSDGYHILHSKIKWEGWYPVVEAGVSYGRENFFTNTSGKSYFSSDIMHIASLDLNINLPLSFSHNGFNQIIMPFIYINHVNINYYPYDFYNYKKKYTIITPRLYFSNTSRKASRDIYPRWGQILDIKAEFAPWEQEEFQSLKGFKSTFFFPGLIRNHSIMIKAGYENQWPVKKTFFSNINSFPRGFEGLVSTKLSVFSGEYTLPIFYPDLSAGSILYLKRIRSSEFFDFASSTGTYDRNGGVFTTAKQNFVSFGSELLADFYLFRIPYEISAGVRAGKKLPDNNFFVESVFSINIYGTTLGRKR
jgi:hypothetical protein